MSTVELEPRTIDEWIEDEFCHLLYSDDTRLCDGVACPEVPLCGPMWAGEKFCATCRRSMCPTCVEIAVLEHSLGHV